MGRIWELVEELNAVAAETATVQVQPLEPRRGTPEPSSPATPPVSPLDPNSPWPPALDGLGVKKVGAFRSCLWCGTGTWMRYAGLPTCLPCARSWPETRTQDGARAYLWRLMDTWGGMDESAWQEANVKALYEDIMDLFKAHPEAEGWFKEWRQAHPGAKLT